LLSDAKQRFSDAAALLEMDTPVLEGLRHRYATERIDLSPLFAMHDELAGRYIQQHFTPQLDLLNPAEMRQDVLWSKYFYHKLIPALMERNDVIRNILRATTLLPCKHPDDASLALVLHCQEMTMPDTLPLWGSSPLLNEMYESSQD
jgi:hypothetical protein